jgi:hypothetical protein
MTQLILILCGIAAYALSRPIVAALRSVGVMQ